MTLDGAPADRPRSWPGPAPGSITSGPAPGSPPAPSVDDRQPLPDRVGAGVVGVGLRRARASPRPAPPASTWRRSSSAGWPASARARRPARSSAASSACTPQGDAYAAPIDVAGGGRAGRPRPHGGRGRRRRRGQGPRLARRDGALRGDLAAVRRLAGRGPRRPRRRRGRDRRRRPRGARHRRRGQRPGHARRRDRVAARRSSTGSRRRSRCSPRSGPLRAAGVPAWATIDAGPHVKVLTDDAHADAVAGRVGAVPGVTDDPDQRRRRRRRGRGVTAPPRPRRSSPPRRAS